MRLLNTNTFEVEEFFTAADTPPYAILSHTWEQDEVTFQDIRDCRTLEAIQHCEKYEEAEKKAGWKKAGWSKVWHACKYVRQYKFDWIWIDTCCIDKSSSAELSEALNSMYNYYGDGRVCITYLSDVSMERDAVDFKEKLKKSRWFTRGWTLQELIAPRFMVFLDHDWKMVGTRYGMRKLISDVTSIPAKVFEQGELDEYSIAQKMSWAASRKTTRDEDMAYCLMGLFGVNMPPIYGEGGAKAFMRLQQEIIKYSEDRSIFAWIATDDCCRDRGLFASSPSEFMFSGEIGISDSKDLGNQSAFSFGNNGLHIHLSLHSVRGIGKDIFVASLHCQTAGDSFIGVYLQKQGQRYTRWNPHFQLPHIDKSTTDLEEVVVKESKALRQQIKKSDYNFPIKFKFDSEITYPNEIDRCVFFRDLMNSHLRLSNPWAFQHPSGFEFNVQTKKGKTLPFWIEAARDDIVPLVRVGLTSIPKPSDFPFTRLADSDVSAVEDALVSGFTHVTGGCLSERVVEINYIPSSNARFQLYGQIDEFRTSPDATSSTVLDFVLDINSDDSFGSPRSVFPSNLAWRQDSRVIYGSFSKRGEQCDLHCVFMYRLSTGYFVVIALGLHTESSCHVPWIDIYTAWDEKAISDIWKSYSPSGLRYKRRQDGVARTSPGYSRSVTITVERKTLIEPGVYHVVIKDEQNPLPDWRPWGDSGTSSPNEGGIRRDPVVQTRGWSRIHRKLGKGRG